MGIKLPYNVSKQVLGEKRYPGIVLSLVLLLCCLELLSFFATCHRRLGNLCGGQLNDHRVIAEHLWPLHDLICGMKEGPKYGNDVVFKGRQSNEVANQALIRSLATFVRLLAPDVQLPNTRRGRDKRDPLRALPAI